VRISKCFYLLDLLVKDLEGYELKELKMEFDTGLISRLRDTMLKVIAQLLGHDKEAVKRFYTDTSIKCNGGLKDYLGGKLKM
jgi:hypothetical protein